LTALTIIVGSVRGQGLLIKAQIAEELSRRSVECVVKILNNSCMPLIVNQEMYIGHERDYSADIVIELRQIVESGRRVDYSIPYEYLPVYSPVKTVEVKVGDSTIITHNVAYLFGFDFPKGKFSARFRFRASLHNKSSDVISEWMDFQVSQ
jgi:hypothetical protein